MNNKVWLAALVAGIVSFLWGWIIFGIALMGFYTANTTVYEGLIREQMNLPVMFLSNLLWGFLMAWLYSRFAGRKSAVGGLVMGAVIGLLTAAWLDLNFLANWNLYTPALLGVDVLANALHSAGVGAAAGWMLRDKTVPA